MQMYVLEIDPPIEDTDEAITLMPACKVNARSKLIKAYFIIFIPHCRMMDRVFLAE